MDRSDAACTRSRRTAWRSAAEHPSLAVLQCAALPVEIAAAANLVLRVGSADSVGSGAQGVCGAFAATSLAFAIAVIPAGVLVDRTPVRRTFAVALTLRTLPMLLGGVLAVGGALTITAVIALAAADGLMMALLRPSWQHFQASLVPPASARDAAVLDDWIARAGAVLGAVGGGLVIASGHTGIGLLACVMGFLPLLAALALGLGAGQCRPVLVAGPSRNLQEAWSALRQVRQLREATRADVILQLAVPVGVLVPAVTVALTAIEYLWLFALAAAIGALAGMSWMTWVWNRLSPAQLLRRSAGVLGAVLLVDIVALASGGLVATPVWLGATCVAIAVGEAATTALFAVTGAIVQGEAPAHVRGGVTGLAQAPKHLAMFVSASVVGLAMSWAGPVLAVGIIAIALTAAVAALRLFRSLSGGPKTREIRKAFLSSSIAPPR